MTTFDPREELPTVPVPLHPLFVEIIKPFTKFCEQADEFIQGQTDEQGNEDTRIVQNGQDDFDYAD